VRRGEEGKRKSCRLCGRNKGGKSVVWMVIVRYDVMNGKNMVIIFEWGKN